MPMGGTKKQPKTPKEPPQPSYPMASDLSEEELAALQAQGYVDYGDGELIPPMDDNPYTAADDLGMEPGAYDVPGLATANPGANAAGGPTGMAGGIRSNIFQSLYERGQQSGNDALMNMGRPPMVPRGLPELPGIDEAADMPDEPFQLAPPPGATPPPRDQWPAHLQGPPQPSGMARNPGARLFPRATSLLGGARTLPARGGERQARRAARQGR